MTAPRLLLSSLLLSLLFALPALPASAQPNPGASPVRDGQHDFDFEIGSWKTHLKRLVASPDRFDHLGRVHGTTVVRKVWEGRANLVELVVDGPAGHLEV